MKSPKSLGIEILRSKKNNLFVKELKYRPWAADYKPPAPPDENSNVKKTPEEIEREIKVSVIYF